jgi:hypothetical protein
MKKIINKITENVKKNTIIGIIFFIWMTMAYVVGIKFLIKTSDVLEVSDRLMYLSAASIFSMSFLYLLKEYTTSFVDLQELSFAVHNLKFGWLDEKILFLINAFLIAIGLVVDVVALAILLNSAYIVLAGNLDKIINKKKINKNNLSSSNINKKKMSSIHGSRKMFDYSSEGASDDFLMTFEKAFQKIKNDPENRVRIQSILFNQDPSISKSWGIQEAREWIKNNKDKIKKAVEFSDFLREYKKYCMGEQ